MFPVQALPQRVAGSGWWRYIRTGPELAATVSDRLRPAWRLAAAIAAGGLAVLALSMFTLPAPTAAQATVVVVRITSVLTPSQLSITPGTTVRWENADTNQHRVRATSGPAEFDGDLEPGDSFSFTFSAIGTYQYRDDRARTLSNYWGTVTVASTATPAPTPTPTAPGAGTSTPGTGTSPPPAPSEVTMAGRVFSPGALTIPQGSVVTWRNNDGREHTVTARDGSFDSGVVAIGGTFQKTFTATGAFSYFCAIHPDMTGTVTVTGASGTVPAPMPTPAASPTPTSTPRPAAASDVQIIDFGFTPAEFHVAVGGTVTWANNGVAIHTVTARDGSFDSGYIIAGGTFSRAFASAGTYQYLCSLHANMTATVVVGATPGAPPPPVVTSTPRAVPASDVRAVDFAFEPTQHQVQLGATVTWANAGVAPHTVTARDGSFDSGTLAPGATFSFRFERAGTFQYLCAFHADMTGTVVVPDATGAAPPPQAAPSRPVTPRSAVPGTSDVEVVDFGFSPPSVQIAAGDSVRWVNSGVAPHTVTAQDGSFDSGYLHRGEQFTRVYGREGTFPYLCSLHPGMVGTVVVGSGGAVAAGTTTPTRPGATNGTPDARGSDIITAASGRVDAEMRDFDFEPAHIVVEPGTTVTWNNTGMAPHTVTARDGSFSSGIKNPGESFEYRFERPGTYDYVCAVHPAMTGSVEVVAESAPAVGQGGGSAATTGAPGAAAQPAAGIPTIAFLTTTVLALALGAAAGYLVVLRISGVSRAR